MKVFATSHPERGGAAIEYLLVSIFALVLTIAAMTGVRAMVMAKLGEVDSGHHIDMSEFKLDIFSGR